LNDEMSRVRIFTTEPCSFCRTAKSLLQARGIDYEETALAKDPQGRAALVELTGMMTFPQILIDGELIGGFQELARADREGRLSDLRMAA
jgi:glutaredoxin 3